MMNKAVILYLIYIISLLIINKDELKNIIYLQHKSFMLNNLHTLIHV